jgi:D-glycero-D-manno-heptose 1,7-bisphosphate phosphatase
MTRQAIFLDRDGTICEEVGYVNHVSRCRLLPRSIEAIRLINRAGYLSVVTTNQAGVARGYFSESLVGEVHARLLSLVAQGGARLDALYYCPHHPSEGRPPYRMECDCRKPRPGMILRAAAEHGIDLRHSFAIGDGLPDIGAAAAAGVPSIQVLTGYGRGLMEHQPERYTLRPMHTAEDLLDAVLWILARQPQAPDAGRGDPP